ncbi:SLC13 family permease [Massilia sp. R2A-15]|uniref:SLC13 family permease n=1 Tax=Massilia sp. R2A-15 TaxID=3064278 RepID=UPI00273316C4|nr:SLC13 family permease [Massilia sp. R2A-15]WLI90593.1 SLC13 family permease [Massilia sp. R2A-15]
MPIHTHPLRTLIDSLRRDTFFLILLAGLAVLAIATRRPLGDYPALVDWPTIGALAGLLALTKGLEMSGAIGWLGHRLVGAMASERKAALSLVAASALLSTVLTNDVALFVVVPLTLGVCRIAALPATRLIVFEALAVNAGSALTPIGNPQNLFIWQQSQVPFAQFVLHMLPLVLPMMAALLALTALAFRSRPIAASAEHRRRQIDRRLLGVSLALYIPFLAAADMHHAGWAVLAVLATFLVLRARVLAQLDWGLLLVFVLMFIDLRLLAGLEPVRDAMHGFGLDQPKHLYLAGIAASQLVSNVPAAIALAEYSRDWRVIAYAVSVGGFGFMAGSLANLIALRMSGDRKAWIGFHAWSVPFLGFAAALGYALLFWLD